MVNIHCALIAVFLFFFPQFLSATTIDISHHSGIIRDSSGNYKTINGRGTVSSINTGTQLQVQNRVPVPTSKGNQYVDISRTALVDLAKVGGALASLARKLTPLGMAAGTVAYICAETNICDFDGEWQIGGDSDLAGYPETTNEQAFYCTGFGCAPFGNDIKSPTATIACSSFASESPDFDFSSASETQCNLTRTSNGSNYTVNINRFTGGCPTNYTWNGSQCVLNGSAEPRPATQTDWDGAEQDLNTADTTDHILDNGGDVPVDVSTPPTLDGSPVNQPAGSETTTLKDSNGNITGTQVTERNIEITDGATSQNPNQINITEKTTVTNYDINNNITSSTETSTEPPANEAPAEQEDIELEFDDVSDSELENYDIPEMGDYTSWGAGSCPPPIPINTNHWDGQIETQPFCDFATGINPFVLAFGALVSAFIITGVRGGGQE